MPTIAEDTVSCIHALEALETTLPAVLEEYRAEMSVKRVIDERDRLRIWAGSLGALQMGTKALTFRLRESPIMETNVKKLLGKLVEVLTGCLEITTGVRAPLESIRVPEAYKDSEYSSGSDSDDDMPRTELGQQMMSITSILSDLFKIAFKFRNKTTRLTSKKPAMYDETVQVDDHTRVSIFASYEKSDRQYVEDTLSHLRQHSTIELHRHISSTTSQDSLQCTDTLAEHLAETITTRRRILRYWQRHAEKLAHVNEEKGNEEIVRHQDEVNRDLRIATSRSERPILAGAEATTYNSVYDNTPDTVSAISFSSTSFDMEGNAIEIPPMPSSHLQLPEFLCPYCRTLIPSREGTGRAWKNHVLRDLMPYLCTYTDCPDGTRMYSSRHDWIEHEKMAHLKEWCCFDHTNTAFKSPSELRRHLETEHNTSVSHSQIQTLVDLGERIAPDHRTMCPICFVQGPFPKGLTDHIAFHFEKFALYSIRGHFFETQVESEEDVDSRIAHGLGSLAASNNSEMSFAAEINQSQDDSQSINLTADRYNTETDRPATPSPPRSPLWSSSIKTHRISPRAFVFQINEISESPDTCSHYDRFKHWTPSTDPGVNIRVPVGISGAHWFCDGQQVYEIPELLSGFSKYSTHSMYFSGGYGFWVLRGDPTMGTETDSWRPLRFDHPVHDYSSFVANAGKEPQLRFQRPDQSWPAMLFPDIYHAPAFAKGRDHGGLNGEISIFLGLVALSMSQDYLHAVLPKLYVDGKWQTHGHRAPRQSRRGVVVDVWAADFPTMVQMENGHFGKYYD